MSKIRHDGSLVRTFAVTFHAPQTVEYPVKGWDQLIYAVAGVVTVTAGDEVWVLPAHKALWVPDGVGHRLEVWKGTALRSLYLRAGVARRLPRECKAVHVTPLVRELILECVRQGALRARKPGHRRLAAVLVDQVEALGEAPLELPQPRDGRAREMIGWWRERPGMGVAEAARRSGAGVRTMERVFQMETGMALGAWLRRMRLQMALEQLAGGASVNEAARSCGYSGASAFVAMFRREMGVTPGQYFGEGD